ncbi:MAG: DNA polymerase I [Pseudomonadota bacterium]
MASKTSQRLVLVDGSGYIFRAYHALPPLTRASDKLPVGAVAGFCNMLWKLLNDTKQGEAPTHFAVIFDASSKTFRNELYEGYKAHRPEAPEDLLPQFGLIRDAVRSFGLPCIEQMNFEADDIIATYARLAEKQGFDVSIISSDKDLMQLVNDKICLLDTMKDKLICRPEVIEKFGVPPEKVIDVQALAGDSVDGVPGVPGIGIKTAALLINEFGDLETLLAKADTIKQQKRRESLIEHAEMARLSQKLVTLDDNVPLVEPLESFKVQEIRGADVIAFCKAMEFSTLTKRIAAAFEVDIDSVEPAKLTIKYWPPENSNTSPGLTHELNAPAAAQPAKTADQQAALETFDYSRYEMVTDAAALKKWIARAYEKGHVAVDTETSSLDALQANLVGISLSTDTNQACYIPLQHRQGESLFDSGMVTGQMQLKDAVALLKPLLEDASVLKIGQNIKYDLIVFRRVGIDVAPFDDTMLISYALDCGNGSHGMDELAKRHLGHTAIPFKDVTAAQKGVKDFSLVQLTEATRYAAEDADITLRLWKKLKPRLQPNAAVSVYETLERPMVTVLADMETAGVLIDKQNLAQLSTQFAKTILERETEIEKMVGAKFNIGSPKQLGEILFEHMKLPGGTKTPSGQWATDAGTLEDLATEGHELPRKILDWRQLSKLKSTYTDALPTYINPETGRVHTSFALASTSTGRLSSSDPNVQNIPIRTEEGRKIRSAFIAAENHKLISADYSQIELRILAHMADIPALKKAFANGDDIHAMTASEMFGVPIKGMDPMVRRRAKAINFGIVYGISAFGLAAQLSISRSEASDYIKTYFERFPGIKAYMSETIEITRKQGYVTTLFGRKCHCPNINSKNQGHRAGAERQAINAPIQGTAADVIRRAMIRMMPALEKEKIRAIMLLQVHDELVFEAHNDDVERATPLIKDVMEKAALPAINLSVPLVVEARAAQNWEAAH